MSTRSPAELCQHDCFAWTQLQAKEQRRFARTRPNLPLDLPHFAEEIADWGAERRSRIRSWTRHFIEHLLLLEHSRRKSRDAAGLQNSSISDTGSTTISGPRCIEM